MILAALLQSGHVSLSDGGALGGGASDLACVGHHLLGFGAPLLIPIVNIVLFPFAIFGATLLYLDTFGRNTTDSKHS